ncbi:MAG: hypothetical protein C0459_02160 [Chitinophaga sp.]|jgi:hypothetical protein|nr:hypothetical protein [Chitinophaga sp.]
MKKTKHIELILITAALASCNQPKNDWESGNKVYIRSDSTAGYSRTHYHGGGYGMWYYAFRPYGNYYNGEYQRAGYYSSAIHESSNIGSNGFKSSVIRGGFGRGGYSVSS